MRDLKIEQRTVIKFLVKSGEKPVEILRKLKNVYQEDSLSKARVFDWAKRFKDGRESVEDDPREGAPCTLRTDENVERLRNLVLSDRRLSIRMMAAELGINAQTVRHMLYENLGMRKLCDKVVPKSLPDDHKELRLAICQDFLIRITTDGNDWLRTIITGDETWVLEYDTEARRQDQQVEEGVEQPKRAKIVATSKSKALLIVFFDIQGVVHQEFVPPGQTINAEFYIDVLERLIQRISSTRPNLIHSGWILHHDNEPARSSLDVREFLAKKSIPTLPHPLCSPDLAPCDFFLFPKLRSHLQGTHLQGLKAVKESAFDALRNLSSEEYERCFERWEQRWRRCVELRGEYCEDI